MTVNESRQITHRAVVLIQVKAGLARAFRAAERVAPDFPELSITVGVMEGEACFRDDGAGGRIIKLEVRNAFADADADADDDAAADADADDDEIPPWHGRGFSFGATEYEFEWGIRASCARRRALTIGRRGRIT